MTEACPISFKTIDERVARVNGALTVLTLALTVFGGLPWLLLPLGADFFIRAFLEPKYSPFAAAGRKLVKALGLAPKMTNAGPKIFAARLGFLFCALAYALYWSGFALAGNTVAGLFMFFAFLEAAFGFCVACKVYPLISALR